jgi:hypothetical protein
MIVEPVVSNYVSYIDNKEVTPTPLTGASMQRRVKARRTHIFVKDNEQD